MALANEMTDSKPMRIEMLLKYEPPRIVPLCETREDVSVRTRIVEALEQINANDAGWLVLP
jgi:hypothetical protein